MGQEIMLRTLRLLMLLIGKRTYSLQELMKRFEIAERTVYRDLETIEQAGFILERDHGQYRLKTDEGQGKALGGLLHFSEEEAYIFCKALEQVEGAPAIQKRLFSKLHALYDFRALSRIRHTSSLEMIGMLRNAMKMRQQVLLQEYRSSNSETISNRCVEPFSFMSDYSAVWCYDTDSKQSKQFRISRMKGVEISDQPWQFCDCHTEPFTDVFRMAAVRPLVTITITLSLKAYNLLREEFPLSENFIQPIKSRFRLEVPVADFNGIGRFVLGLSGEVEVIAPESFKEFLNKQVKKF